MRKFYLKNKDIRVLIENFISLSMLQLLNNLLPILTMPYLFRVLGPAKFGLISLAQALIQYFINLTDYGFNLTATRDISLNYNNNNETHRCSDEIILIFNRVMIIKFILMIISFILMSIIVFLTYNSWQYYLLYLFTFVGLVIGEVIFSSWFYQGIQKMKYITILSFISKIFFTVSIFIFVKSEEDFLLVPLLTMFGFMIGGISSLIIIFTKFKMKIVLPSVESIKSQLKDGWQIFYSTLVISIISNSGVLLLGIFTNETLVGYYSAGEKLIKAIQRMLYPIQQAVYPYLNRITRDGKKDGVIFLKKLILVVGSGILVLMILLLFFSEFVTNLLFGNGFGESLLIFRIMVFFLVFNTIGRIFSLQTMLAFNMKKAFSNIMTWALCINLTCQIILIHLFQHIGAAVGVVITEIFICVYSYMYISKKGINIMKGNIDA